MINLITGGAGFIGSHLADRLIAEGEEVIVLDVYPPVDCYKIKHLLDNKHFYYFCGSVLDKECLIKLVQKSQRIFHFAAIVGVEYYLSNPLDVLNVNIEGTKNVLELAQRYERKVIFASTSEIYGRNTKIPFKEEDERVLGPTSINRWSYASAKAVCEHYCFAYAEKGVPLVILRFFNAYGPRLDSCESGRVVSIFIGKILNDKPITIVGSGRQTRCFTFISDTIEGIVRAANSPFTGGEVFNIGTDTETSILDLAKILIEISGKKREIVYLTKDEYGLGYEDIFRRVPDVSKVKRMLGFTAKEDIYKGLEVTFNWFKDNWDFLFKHRLHWMKKNGEGLSNNSRI